MPFAGLVEDILAFRTIRDWMAGFEFTVRLRPFIFADIQVMTTFIVLGLFLAAALVLRS